MEISGRWSKERVWEWYNKQPWMRGCNFMGSDCANRIDQWQALGFEERIKTADRELKLAAETGFNTIRIILEYIVWRDDHDAFMERLDRYLDTAYQYGIRAMIVFGNDCLVTKDNPYSNLQLGVQKYDWGYHGGRKWSQHSDRDKANEPGYSLLDEPDQAVRIYEWVREIIEKYKNDDRVVFWDLYNEPGNSRRTHITMPHLKKFFEIARDVNPMQPLTSAIWHFPSPKMPEVELFCLENSDVISYHSYGPYTQNIKFIQALKQHERPILCTEWLGRTFQNRVQEMFPLFFLEKIGCYCWGFVAGLYQTYEPWEAVWERYKNGTATDIDFTVWFHDLYRPSLRPYDPHETDLIKEFCDLADKYHNENKSI